MVIMMVNNCIIHVSVQIGYIIDIYIPVEH